MHKFKEKEKKELGSLRLCLH